MNPFTQIKICKDRGSLGRRDDPPKLEHQDIGNEVDRLIVAYLFENASESLGFSANPRAGLIIERAAKYIGV